MFVKVCFVVFGRKPFAHVVFDLIWKLNKWIEVNQSVAWLVTWVMKWTKISEHSKKNGLFVEAFRNYTDLWLWREPPLKRLEDWYWIGVTIQSATRYWAIIQVRQIYYSGILLVSVSFNRSWLCAWLHRWCICGKPLEHGILMVCVLCVLFLFSLDRCMNLDVYFGV